MTPCRVTSGGRYRRAISAAWRTRSEVLLGERPRLVAISVHLMLRAEGLSGFYPTVVLPLCEIRGSCFRAAGA